jgi:glyoxylase-like metal-dependent hydrolase (beta-lactamase superfamily II)
VGEQFSLAVIAKIKELVPDKPVRYLINSHTHFDHWAGMRTYVAEDATIITAKDNEAYYKDAFQWPRTLYDPDRLAQHPSPLKIQPVADKYVLTDGARSIEIYALPCDRHTMGSVMVYTHLSNAEFLTSADTAQSCLVETLDRQKIAKTQIVMAPIHGGYVGPLVRPQ